MTLDDLNRIEAEADRGISHAAETVRLIAEIRQLRAALQTIVDNAQAITVPEAVAKGALSR